MLETQSVSSESQSVRKPDKDFLKSLCLDSNVVKKQTNNNNNKKKKKHEGWKPIEMQTGPPQQAKLPQREGTKSLDKNLKESTRKFHFSPRQHPSNRLIYLPGPSETSRGSRGTRNGKASFQRSGAFHALNSSAFHTTKRETRSPGYPADRSYLGRPVVRTQLKQPNC